MTRARREKETRSRIRGKKEDWIGRHIRFWPIHDSPYRSQNRAQSLRSVLRPGRGPSGNRPLITIRWNRSPMNQLRNLPSMNSRDRSHQENRKRNSVSSFADHETASRRMTRWNESLSHGSGELKPPNASCRMNHSNLRRRISKISVIRVMASDVPIPKTSRAPWCLHLKGDPEFPRGKEGKTRLYKEHLCLPPSSPTPIAERESRVEPEHCMAIILSSDENDDARAPQLAMD